MIPPKIYGLIGYPVKHSLSPAMHNAAFRHLKINAEYRLFEVRPEELNDFLLGNMAVKDTQGNEVHSGDVIGFNVTIPHKIRAKEILESKVRNKDVPSPLVLEEEHYVKVSGAINTVKRNVLGIQYFNTDASGFIESLRDDLEFDVKDKNTVVIGCGGAGRAVVASLSWKNINANKIYIYDINSSAVEETKIQFSKIEYIGDKIEFIDKKSLMGAIKNSQLLVNASSCGMKDEDGSIVERGLLHNNLSVYDVVYNRETQLIKDAHALGLKAVNGAGMLLCQGARAFELWFNRRAPKDVMKQALEKELAKWK
ncbi:MAG: shikimate dehydrogenase [Candidatus Omnitrophota bacterium]|jgi:shikimate dehydrogenase|nr:MAG: shikimate dehydrogenase [Candidatus Omnitrophota bacterium]